MSPAKKPARVDNVESRLPHHTRRYEIAGITVQVQSDLPITDATFHEKFASFRVDGPGDDTFVIRHHFGLPQETPGFADHLRHQRGLGGGAPRRLSDKHIVARSTRKVYITRT